MNGFVKLYGTILTSSIWLEDDPTLRVWITMLATADKNGVVAASVGGLAHVARVKREKCERALEKFLAPDEDSRTKADDGRRIEVVDGGWRILNHKKYRDMRTDDQVKEAERKANWRARQRDDGTGRDSPGTGADIRADAEADAYTEPPPSLAVERFLAELPDDQKSSHWLAIINGWRQGMGFEGGKAATDADIDTGLTEYLAGANRDFSVIHVRSFVERTYRARIKSNARPSAKGNADAARVWELIKSQGIHHRTTQREIDIEVQALVDAGAITSAAAFKTILAKLDFDTLRKAQTPAFAVNHIETRMNGSTGKAL